MTRAHDPAGRIWARLAAIRTRCASPDARPRPASPAALPGWRAWDAFAGRIEAGTPATRDRGADALRALAILGVIAGHWLVTAWVVDDLGHLRVTSPLSAMPGLVPLSWVLQTLAVFFFVGGYAAGGGAGGGQRGRGGGRVGKKEKMWVV
ncbi:hypothetical protein ABZU32_21235, partial [Sphaerisporangium sp. NPDC005288]